MLRRLMVVGVCVVASWGQSRAELVPDPAIACDLCDAWNVPQEPFRLFGNTYFVGTAEIGAVLIASDNGLILVDSAMPQSVLQIDANIRALGFQTSDVRLIVNSHAHFDHGGGIAALQRFTGAIVAASEAGARGLREGGPVPGDPQFAFNDRFPAVPDVEVVADGETLRVGDLAITPHYTPGHTPGGTTWTWVSCEGERCLNMVYAESLTAVSADDFRFSGGNGAPSVEAEFRASIDKVSNLPCDVLMATHTGFVGMRRKLEARVAQPGTNPFIDPLACQRYAETAREGLERRLAEEG
jgi:metallo-beta-lactamase class B